MYGEMMVTFDPDVAVNTHKFPITRAPIPDTVCAMDMVVHDDDVIVPNTRLEYDCHIKIASYVYACAIVNFNKTFDTAMVNDPADVHDIFFNYLFYFYLFYL